MNLNCQFDFISYTQGTSPQNPLNYYIQILTFSPCHIQSNALNTIKVWCHTTYLPLVIKCLWVAWQRLVRLKMAACTQGMEVTLRNPQQGESKHLQTKTLCYTIVKNSPRLLPYSEAETKKFENFNFVILLSSSFFFLLLFSFFFFFLSSFFILLHHACITINSRTHINVLHLKRMLYYRRGVFSGQSFM